MALDLEGVCGCVVHHTKDFVRVASKPFFSQVGEELKQKRNHNVRKF